MAGESNGDLCARFINQREGVVRWMRVWEKMRLLRSKF
jgi:hypothetical protein